MDFFSQRFISIYFIALIVCGVVLIVTKILRNLYIEQTIKTLLQLPDDKKERITHLYRTIISTQRIFIWIVPFGFVLTLATFILLVIFPELISAIPGTDLRQVVMLMGICFVIGFIHFAEDSYYKKKILKAIEKSI
jgi:hypothetical protein